MFKWVCLLVAVAALSAFGWMLNDMRLQVRGLAANADKELVEIKRLTTKADKVLTQSEQVAKQLDDRMPRILAETEKATTTLNQQLPTLLSHTESTVDSMEDLSIRFKQYLGMMGAVHSANQNKGLFSYASSILDLIEGQNATVGLKKTRTDEKLKQAQPAKEWANTSRKDAQLLSVGASSKAEVLNGLARTSSATPWYIQFGEKAPRLLADWIKDTHPESKDVK